MTSCYTSLYYVNNSCNRRTAEDSTSDDMGWAAARSEQLPASTSVCALASTQKADTLNIHCKRSSELSHRYFCFQWLTTGVFSAFQTCHMFKIRPKVDCNLIYLSVQLKKSFFILKSVLLLNNESWDDKICNSNGKLCWE